MPKGYSLHVGVNNVCTNHYEQNLNLNWCINDARKMREIARDMEYCYSELLTENNATAENVFEAIKKARMDLTAGDIFLVSFSGHGTQCVDYSHDETDHFDEAWVLYNRMLIDDELRKYWAQFEEYVRVVVVSDCCYSGSMLENADSNAPVAAHYDAQEKSISRLMANQVMKKNMGDYIQVMCRFPLREKPVKASILELTACRRNEAAKESGDCCHGLFTYHLAEVLNKGGCANYFELYNKIAEKMYGRQNPDLQVAGKNCMEFYNYTPFAIE